MNSYFSVFVLYLVLFTSSTHATRFQRELKQGTTSISTSVSVGGDASCIAINGVCDPAAQVSSQEINNAATSIATALATAVAQAGGGGDVQASAVAFSQAVTRAYAILISSHATRVFTSAQAVNACAFTQSSCSAYATAISTAVSTAFAQSSNDFARASAACFAGAVASAAVTAIQNANFGTCTNYGEELINTTLTTVGFVEAVANAFSSVFTAIRDRNAAAAATCGAFGASTISVSAVQTDVSG